MRCQKLAGFEAGGPSLPPRRAISLPCASTIDSRGPRLGAFKLTGMPGAQLADHEGRRFCTAAVKAAGPMQVVPLRFKLAVAIEHLYAMVLAVGHVHPAVVVGSNIVRDIELPRFAAGLAPRHQQLACR